MTKCKNCGCKTSIEGSNLAITRQVGGKHYKGKIQPIELIVEHNLDFIDGNIVKYAIRKKNGESDKESEGETAQRSSHEKGRARTHDSRVTTRFAAHRTSRSTTVRDRI